jgi:hypothetical protein
LTLFLIATDSVPPSGGVVKPSDDQSDSYLGIAMMALSLKSSLNSFRRIAWLHLEESEAKESA